MAKTNDQDAKSADKAAAAKKETALKAQGTKAAEIKKPADEKAKTPAKKTVDNSAAGKETIVKTQQKKPAAEKKKPADEKAKAPAEKVLDNSAAGKKETAKKTGVAKASGAPVKPSEGKGTGPVMKTEAKAKKAKSSFARKMEGVKDVAAVIGQKIAEVAKDVSIKSDNLEDAIASGLQDMKKDIHRVAESIAEKTKE